MPAAPTGTVSPRNHCLLSLPLSAAESGPAGRSPRHRRRPGSSGSWSGSSVAAPKSVDNAAQRTRDLGSRNILQTELDKANQQLAELKKEFNNGEPEKMGPEHRNHQKYLDRVASLKSSIARTESDIQGIKRELGRAGG